MLACQTKDQMKKWNECNSLEIQESINNVVHPYSMEGKICLSSFDDDADDYDDDNPMNVRERISS